MKGAVVTVTPTTQPLYAFDDIKTWLRTEEEELSEDPLVEGLVKSAISLYQSYTRRVPLQTTFDYVMDCAPCGPVEMPRHPLVSVTGVFGYTDADATDTGGATMDPSTYYVDTASTPGRVVPLGGGVYPTATRSANAFRVRFVAGESSDWSGVPEDVKSDIKAMVARGIEHRGDEAGMEHAMITALGSWSCDVPDWG